MIKTILIIIGILFTLFSSFLGWCCCKAAAMTDREMEEIFEDKENR